MLKQNITFAFESDFVKDGRIVLRLNEIVAFISQASASLLTILPEIRWDNSCGLEERESDGETEGWKDDKWKELRVGKTKMKETCGLEGR